MSFLKIMSAFELLELAQPRMVQIFDRLRNRRFAPKRSVADYPVVVRVTSDPKPQNAVGHINTKRTVGYADTDRNEISNIRKVKRGMRGILLEEFEVLLGEFLHVVRQRLKTCPKIW